MSETLKLRVARPTDEIDGLLPFYGNGLGLEVLYRFTDHDGIDGLMLGHPASPYHFEFTFDPVVSLNPYWDRQGVTFEDPDGYRLELQNASWSL